MATKEELDMAVAIARLFNGKTIGSCAYSLFLAFEGLISVATNEGTAIDLWETFKCLMDADIGIICSRIKEKQNAKDNGRAAEGNA